MKKNHSLLKEWGIKVRYVLFIFQIALSILFLGHVKAVAASPQSTINLSMKDVLLKDVIWEIEKQTGFIFAYNANDLVKAGKVSVEIKGKNINEALDICLKGTGLTHVMEQDVIVIKQMGVVTPEVKKITIRGKVMDRDSVSLPGVTILLKGTRFGVVSGVDGKYSIVIPVMGTPVLVYSFIGMKPKEVKCTSQEVIDVVMVEDVKSMDEVVITGYQTINRKDMVGAYNTVKVSDIMMPAYSSIDQMLQGQVPGMIVTNTSSRVGTNPKIQIRGTSTILGNQDPLWVVDGIIQEDPIKIDASSAMTDDLKNILGNQISWLNPQDIETITVLKDASATAIYGSKASNGVIVVTTKKGKNDRLSVNYSGNFSMNARPNYGQFNVMNSLERVRFAEEAYAWGAFYEQVPIKQWNTFEGAMRTYLEGGASREEYMDRKRELEEVNTDWFKLLTRNAFSHNHNLSVSGGTEKFNYMASIGYNISNGQEIGNSSERMSGRLSVGMQLRKNLRVTASLNGSVGTNEGYASKVDPLGYAMSTSRAIPTFYENGDRLFYQKVAGYKLNNQVKSLGFNILNEIDNSGATSRSTQLAANLDVSWNITNWLTYQFTGGYNDTKNNSEVYYLERTFQIAREYRGYDYNSVEPDSPEFKAAKLPFGGELFTTDASRGSYNIQNKLLISKEFNTNNRLNVMLGVEVRSSHLMNNSNTVWGYVPERGRRIMEPTPLDKLKPIGAANGDSWGVLTGLYKNDRWVKSDKTDNFFSLFATFAYSWMNRYVFNFNVRNDASNRFGQDVNNRVDPTYSFGASWRMSEEPFMANLLKVVSQLNLKATYGIQGNALTSMSPDLILKQQGIAKVFNQYAARVVRLPNPDLSWERTRTWNLGVELELFRKINVNVDYYTRRSNAVVSQVLSDEYGMRSMEQNGGLVYNSGMEFLVSFTPVSREDFAVSVNSSKNWNKTGKPIIDVALGDVLGGRSDIILKEGYALGSMWSYSFKGLSDKDGRPLFNLLDVAEEDRRPDIDPTSFLVYSGQKDPFFTGGMNLGIRYKSFHLASSFSLLLGGKKRLPSPYANFERVVNIPGPESNLSRDLLKRWKKPGDERITSIPGLVKSMDYALLLPNREDMDMISAWAQSDAMVVDASFLRCRQISLSWDVVPELCKRIGMKSVSVTANVNNIFVIASKRFNGLDPELGDSVMPRTFSAGINVGF